MVTLGFTVKVRNWKASTNSREWNSIKTRKIVQNSRSWLVSNRRTQHVICVRFYASALFSLTRHSWLRKRSTVMFWPMRHVIFLEKIRYLYLPPKACFISMTNYKDDARNDTCKDWSPKLWSIFLSVFFKNSLISIGSYFPWRVMIRNQRWRKQVSSFSTDLQALGMENGDIPNENINGSTSLSGYEAWKGRLNGKSCWRPAQNLDGEHITVTFASKKTVIAIATQGSPDGNFWIESFTYQYFADASLNDPNKVKSTNIDCTGQGRPGKIFLSVTMKHKHFRMMMILKFQSLLLSRTFSMRVCDSRFFWRRQICEINVSQKFPMIRYLISKSFRPCFRPPLICGAQPMIRCAAVKF